MGIHPIEDYLQSDASLPAGFAGGPMVDAGGRVAGMSTALVFGEFLSLGPEVGIGLSVPVEWIERGLDWIRAGQPTRAWIGLHSGAATPEHLEFYSLPDDVHRIVEVVFPDSPAERAGLRVGDGIRLVNGRDPARLYTIQEELLAARPGDTWPVEIQRGRDVLSLRVVLSDRPDQPRLPAVDALRFYGGVEVAQKGSRLRVVRVRPESVAEARKIEPGSILKSVFIKKNIERAQKYNARWRSVKDLEDLERLVAYAYSDLDFYVGLRFKTDEGEKQEVFLFEMLIATKAL